MRIPIVDAVIDAMENEMIRKAPLGAAFAAALLFDSAAQAHPKLTGLTPAANATVASGSKIELHFSKKLIMTEMPGTKKHAAMKMARTGSGATANSQLHIPNE